MHNPDHFIFGVSIYSSPPSFSSKFKCLMMSKYKFVIVLRHQIVYKIILSTISISERRISPSPFLNHSQNLKHGAQSFNVSFLIHIHTHKSIHLLIQEKESSDRISTYPHIHTHRICIQYIPSLFIYHHHRNTQYQTTREIH